MGGAGFLSARTSTIAHNVFFPRTDQHCAEVRGQGPLHNTLEPQPCNMHIFLGNPGMKKHMQMSRPTHQF